MSTFRMTLLAVDRSEGLAIWTIRPWWGLVLSICLTRTWHVWGALFLTAVYTLVGLAMILRVNVTLCSRFEKRACAALQMLPLLPTWTALTVRVSRKRFPSLLGSLVALVS